MVMCRFVLGVALLAVLVLFAVGALADDVCLCGGQKSDKDAPVKSLTTRFTYKAVVPELPAGTKSLDLWLPIPSDSQWQTVRDVQVSSPYPYRITQEQKFGNRMVYVRVTGQGTRDKLEVAVSFIVERKEVRVFGRQWAGQTKTCSCSPNCNCPHCQADKTLRQLSLQPETLVPVGGRFLTIATEVTQGKQTKLEKIRALFEHVVATMQYDYKRESPKLGEGDVAFVCDFRKGNCSDLHSYLISLARSLGIPAYLEYGFPLAGIPLPDPLPKEGKIWRLPLLDLGLRRASRFGFPLMRPMPADGWTLTDPKSRTFLFGNLVLERSAVAVSRGRDIVLNPPQKGKPLNYFIYPYAEADGQSVKVNWELTYQLLP
jgi:transglutaminase-like putative cysteine protease